MATREASQEHAVPLELQQALVALQAAKHLSNSVQYLFGNPMNVGPQTRARREIVQFDKQPENVTDHGFGSFTMYNAAARPAERVRST
jgi:hypothetical protein